MSGSNAALLTAATTDDVADLRAMLANTEALVRTLRSELDLTTRALKESDKELSEAKDESAKLEAQVDRLEDKVAELEANPIGNSEIEDLAGVRALLKKGEVDRARDGLERLLDGLDTCWRNRTGIVIGQGALL